MKILTCLLGTFMMATGYAQIVVINPGNNGAVSLAKINSNFSYLNLNKITTNSAAVIALWTGTCNASSALLGNGTCGTIASGAFSGITSGTNTTAAMVLGTGSSLSFSGSGTVNANLLSGITYSGTAAAHSVEVITTANTTATPKVLPDCIDTGGQHLNYTQGTDLFSCGNSGGGGGSTATAITTTTLGSLPGTCAVGDVRYVTNATVSGGGYYLYFCNSANTWVQFGYVAGGSGALQFSCVAGACTGDIVSSVVPIIHAPTTLTDGATVTWAMASIPNLIANLTFTVHGGSRTLVITNPVSGGYYTLNIKQDGTGPEALVLGSGCTWAISNGGGGTINLPGAANEVDILAFYYDGARTTCYGNFNALFN